MSKSLLQVMLSLPVLLLGFTFGSAGFASEGELKFTSVVTSVNQADVDSGTVVMSIRSLDVPIVVNGGTDIRFQSENIGLADLDAGDIVEVRAFLSDEGFTASVIEILETRFQRFRFTGEISQLITSGEDRLVVIAETQILVNAATEISARGDDDALNVDDLVTGGQISVSGRYENGELVAERMFLGQREAGEIDLEGDLLTVSADSVTVEIASSISVVVSIVDTTRIEGTLAVGTYVEVEGAFSEDLGIIARKIEVDADGDRDADDDSRGRGDDGVADDGEDSEIGREIRLRTAASNLEGKAEVRLRTRSGVADQKLEIELENSEADLTYTLWVYFGEQVVEFGTLSTDQFGEAEVEFEIDDDISDRDLAPLLPEGLNVLDISAVEVLLDGAVVLEGSFVGGQFTDDESSDDDSAGDSDDDGSDDGDSASGEDVEVETDINAVSDSGLSGSARIRYRGEATVDQSLKVEIEDVGAGMTFNVVVVIDGEEVDFGAMTANAEGEAEAEWEIDDSIDDRDLSLFLPEGKSVLDISIVQVLDTDANLVGEASF